MHLSNIDDILVYRYTVDNAVIDLCLNEILLQKNTKLLLSRKSSVPQTTITDIYSGKSRIKKCLVKILYKIAKN